MILFQIEQDYNLHMYISEMMELVGRNLIKGDLVTTEIFNEDDPQAHDTDLVHVQDLHTEDGHLTDR